MDIEIIRDLPAELLAPLVHDSELDGCRHVRRLADEWESGSNRFDRAGERFFVARTSERIVGVCGLNVDPFIQEAVIQEAVGRVRRLYVLRAYRGQGIGRRLVQAVIAAGSGHFDVLRVRTGNPQTDTFYEKLGFQPVADVADCTHTLKLTPGLRQKR